MKEVADECSFWYSGYVDINPRVSLLSFDGTKVTFQYTVDARDCNLMGSLHGGAIATLADNLTTYAALLDDRNFRAGVSVSLEVDYMSAPRPGEVITIECVPEKTGKYLSFSSATFVNSKVRFRQHFLCTIDCIVFKWDSDTVAVDSREKWLQKQDT